MQIAFDWYIFKKHLRWLGRVTSMVDKILRTKWMMKSMINTADIILFGVIYHVYYSRNCKKDYKRLTTTGPTHLQRKWNTHKGNTDTNTVDD